MKKLKVIFAFAALYFTGCTEKNITNSYGPQDWQGPVLEWQSVPDAEVRGTVGIDIEIVDSSSVAWARLYADGLPLSELTAEPYRFEVNSENFLDGVHVLEVRAEDAYGNLGVSPVLRINVANSMAQGPQLIWVPDDYPLIQAAINASTDFDTIRVRDGVYYETLNLFGKGIWLESENGPVNCTILGINSWNTILVSSSVHISTIRGFRLTGAQVVVRYDDGAQALLSNNIVLSDTSWSLLYVGSSGGDIRNNIFAGTQSEYPSIQLAYFWGCFENNIIMDAATGALYNVAINVNPVFHGFNCFWNNYQNYGGFTSEIGEFEADPLLDSLSFRLIVGSPCINSGNPMIYDLDSTRSDIGLFGGPLAYP